MSKVMDYVDTNDKSRDVSVMWWCPGCDMHHMVNTTPNKGSHWDWNGSLENPTLSPSIKSTRYLPHPEGASKKILDCCHFFVRNRQIVYCSDSTHHLAGKTVDMLPVSDWPY